MIWFGENYLGKTIKFWFFCKADGYLSIYLYMYIYIYISFLVYFVMVTALKMVSFLRDVLWWVVFFFVALLVGCGFSFPTFSLFQGGMKEAKETLWCKDLKYFSVLWHQNCLLTDLEKMVVFLRWCDSNIQRSKIFWVGVTCKSPSAQILSAC